MSPSVGGVMPKIADVTNAHIQQTILPNVLMSTLLILRDLERAEMIKQ